MPHDLQPSPELPAPATLFDKVWAAHVVDELSDGEVLLYVDRHLLNEVTSPQAFEGLRVNGRRVRRPELTLAVSDHNVPTTGRDRPIADPESRLQVETLEHNVAEFAVPYIGLRDPRQGIVHVVAPELGLTQPGQVIVCGDSHTSTHGAFGALAFGIGTSEVEHVLATQTIRQQRPRSMLITFEGRRGPGVTAKDLVLALIAEIGVAGGAGHVIEYAGEVIQELGMEARMTVCNMSIEAGARAGLIAPDETTYSYLRTRPHAPNGGDWTRAEARWRTLPSDPRARYDREARLSATEVSPMVSWGTTPAAAVPITGAAPDPTNMEPGPRREQVQTMLDYMGLQPGAPLRGLPIDVVFLGSCTNARLEDLREAAGIVRGRKVASGVRALVAPGSGRVKAAAEAEGLDRVFLEAGFEWREAGCSMCLGMNEDRLAPGERCASTSNRNFEGRQGPGGRTHLMSPIMAAAAAVAGRLVDARDFI